MHIRVKAPTRVPRVLHIFLGMSFECLLDRLGILDLGCCCRLSFAFLEDPDYVGGHNATSDDSHFRPDALFAMALCIG